MRKRISFLIVIAIAFTLGLSVNNTASSSVPVNFKVAVVDVNKVIASSSKVKALKEQQKLKKEDLLKFLKTAKYNLSVEKSESKKKSLEKKYNKQLAQKKKALNDEYRKKLGEIEANITKIMGV